MNQRWMIQTVMMFVFAGLLQFSYAQDEYGMGGNVYPLKNNIQINPAGFLQFGPMVQLEIKVAPSVVIFPHVRLAGLGLLSHLAVDYDNLDVSSMALGAGVRMLPGSGKHRPYFGIVGEYGWGTGSDNAGEYYNAVNYEHTYFTIVGNGGFRWRFGSMFIQAGGYAGVVIETSDRRLDPVIEYGNDTEFIAMLEFAFGFEF